METCLNVQSLNKSFGSLNVLKNWNLNIKKAERIALIGPSGCGKTSFLRIIAGLDKPSSGKIFVNTDNTGFVFQESRLIPWRNIKDNLLFVNQNADIEDILQKLHLEGFEKYFPSQLSGGMQQRVNLARALLINPELLILDEAFSSLDLPVKMSIIKDLLTQWEEKQFTIITVTHDLKEALYLADRIVILSAQPAEIRHNFKVDLGKNRALSSPAFLELESRLLSLIYQI